MVMESYLKQVDTKKIWIISPRQWFLFKEYEKAGYTVFDPYIGFNKIIPRFFRIIHFKLNLPFKYLWYRKLPNNIPKLIVIVEGTATDDYLKWLRDKVKDINIINIFMNKIKNSKEIQMVRKYNCVPTTSDPRDAEKYGITTKMSALYLRHFLVDKQKTEYDVFYIGRAKKGREKILKCIMQELNKQGLTVKTHVVSPYPYGITLGKYKKLIEYKEILSALGKTRAILHIAQGASSGITFRVMESVVNQIKLITDDLSIIETPVYCKENIFLIGKDSMNDINVFLNTPFKPISEEIKDIFYFDTDINKYLLEQPENYNE